MFYALSEPKTWHRLGLLSLVVGGFLLYLAFSLSGEQNAAAKWPTVDGRVDDVEIIRQSDTAYYPKAVYSYGLRGRSYTGTKIWLGEPRVYRTIALASAAVPGVSNLVPVHYDPSAPEHCALRMDGETGLLATAKGRWGLGLVALALGCFVLGFMINRSQESWHVA